VVSSVRASSFRVCQEKLQRLLRVGNGASSSASLKIFEFLHSISSLSLYSSTTNPPSHFHLDKFLMNVPSISIFITISLAIKKNSGTSTSVISREPKIRPTFLQKFFLLSSIASLSSFWVCPELEGECCELSPTS
jgi:hypothetical protein